MSNQAGSSAPSVLLPPPAKTFERKKRRSRCVLALEHRSPLRRFFTAGVEYDDGVDRRALEDLAADFEVFAQALELSSRWGEGVELKLRRLGRHRADGLYYPRPPVLVVDVGSLRSFAHEFGHLVDHRGGGAGASFDSVGTLSQEEGFAEFRQELVAGMRRRCQGDPRLGEGRGRLSWTYFASETECFARAFEQFAAEELPGPSILAREPRAYGADPLFFEAVPPELRRYFRWLLAREPRDPPSGAHRITPPSRTTP